MSSLLISKNKNVLTVAFCLSCLEISLRNEDVINCTQNMIYLLTVFYFYFIDIGTFYLFLN